MVKIRDCINYKCDMSKNGKCESFDMERYLEIKGQNLLFGSQVKRRDCNRFIYKKRNEENEEILNGS